MSILIAPASSRTNTHVIDALLSASSSPPLRLLAHNVTSQASLANRYPTLSSAIAVADLLDPSSLTNALTDIKTIFYNAPLSGDELRMSKNMIDAALAAGVEHFVYSGGLHPYISKMAHHWVKLETEEFLFESGLQYTILQPTHLMQNLSLPSTIESRILPIAFSSTVLQGFLDLHDLAAVAASILISPGDHIRARYELVGVNCTYADVAQALANYSREHGGEAVKCVRVPKELALKAMEDRGVIRDDFGRRALEVMFDYYNARGIPGSTNTLHWLLGREPTTWEGLIKRELDAASKY